MFIISHLRRYLDRLRYIGEFRRSLKDPTSVQSKMLLLILKRNKNTEYGRKYNFSKIKSVSDFREKVPVIGYDEISDLIERMKDGEKNILVDSEVIFFATSSGTTSKPKYIPITKRRLDDFKREFFLWARYVLKDHIGLLKGRTLYFAAGDFNGRVKCGIPHGNISGFHVRHVPWILSKRIVLNPDVYNIKDPDERMRTIAIEALKVRKITQIAFTFPIEAIKFFEYLKEKKDYLIMEVSKSDPKRAKELTLTDMVPIKIWPDICLISCIKSGMNELYIENLLKLLGKKVDVRDPGIYSSEGRITNGFSKEGYSGLISASFNFFEFRERREGELLDPVLIGQLELGKEYSIIMTTHEGLYRYEIGDVVKVVGFWNKLPLVDFVSRNKFLDIAGEHSPEELLVKGVKESADILGVSIRGFTIVPYFKNSSEDLRYEILFEPTSDISEDKAMMLLIAIEKRFQDTILTYKKSRNEFGRFAHPVLSIVKSGSYDSFDKSRMTRGQVKVVNVSQDKDFRNNLSIKKTYGLELK